MNTYEIKLQDDPVLEVVEADKFEQEQGCFNFYVGLRMVASYPVITVIRVKRLAERT